MAEFVLLTHPWLLGLGFIVFMLLAAEAGFLVGKRTSLPVEHRANIQAVGAALLGVLALLLGFTMSMAVTRFEDRRQLILEEANALGTSNFRAQLMPKPEGPVITGLLRDYVDTRMSYYSAGTDVGNLLAIRARTATLQEEIWQQLNSITQRDNRSIPAGLLVQSMNAAFDLEVSNWAALNNHVPATVIFLNALVSLFAALFVGYSFGLDGRRHLFSAFMLAICISIVMAVIIDLDQPRGGLIRVTRLPMIDLQHSLSHRPAAAPNH